MTVIETSKKVQTPDVSYTQMQKMVWGDLYVICVTTNLTSFSS